MESIIPDRRHSAAPSADSGAKGRIMTRTLRPKVGLLDAHPKPVGTFRKAPAWIQVNHPAVRVGPDDFLTLKAERCEHVLHGPFFRVPDSRICRTEPHKCPDATPGGHDPSRSARHGGTSPFHVTCPGMIGSLGAKISMSPLLLPVEQDSCLPQTLTTNCRVRIYIRMEQNSRKIVRRLKKDGFLPVSVRGSHHKFRRGQTTVIVPHPKKNLPVGTAKAIAKQAGWLKETDR